MTRATYMAEDLMPHVQRCGQLESVSLCIKASMQHVMVRACGTWVGVYNAGFLIFGVCQQLHMLQPQVRGALLFKLKQCFRLIHASLEASATNPGGGCCFLFIVRDGHGAPPWCIVPADVLTACVLM